MIDSQHHQPVPKMAGKYRLRCWIHADRLSGNPQTGARTHNFCPHAHGVRLCHLDDLGERQFLFRAIDGLQYGGIAVRLPSAHQSVVAALRTGGEFSTLGFEIGQRLRADVTFQFQTTLLQA